MISQEEGESVVTAYIAIPSDIERDRYIRNCFLQQRVSVKTESGAFINRVPISALWLNFVRFPNKTEENGSPVLLINVPLYNSLVVSTLLPEINEIADLTEHEFKFVRTVGDSVVEIQGSAKNGILSLSVNSDKNSEIHLNVYNKNKKGLLKCAVNGDVDIEADGNVEIRSAKTIMLSAIDEKEIEKRSTFAQTSDTNQFTNEKFLINDGKEPITLGNKMKELFDALVEKLGQSTTTTSLGQMPLLNAAQIEAMKDESAKILSEISFTD